MIFNFSLVKFCEKIGRFDYSLVILVFICILSVILGSKLSVRKFESNKEIDELLKDQEISGIHIFIYILMACGTLIFAFFYI